MSKAIERKPSPVYFKRWALTAFPAGLVIGGALGIKYGNLLIGLSIGAAIGVGFSVSMIVAFGVWSAFGETSNN